MTNKQRNIEATCIHRQLATGAAQTDIEAAVNTIVRVLTGYNLASEVPFYGRGVSNPLTREDLSLQPKSAADCFVYA